MIAHSVRVLHGKNQPTLRTQSRDTKESAIASRICTRCSAASGIFITNQKRLVTASHLLESLLGCNGPGFREGTLKFKPGTWKRHRAGSQRALRATHEGPCHILRQENSPSHLDLQREQVPMTSGGSYYICSCGDVQYFKVVSAVPLKLQTFLPCCFPHSNTGFRKKKRA